ELHPRLRSGEGVGQAGPLEDGSLSLRQPRRAARSATPGHDIEASGLSWGGSRVDAPFCDSPSVADQRVEVVVAEARAAPEELELDDAGDALDHPAELADEFRGSR